jgi:hypothetical protein
VTKLGKPQEGYFDLYYDYEVESGLTASEASNWLQKLMDDENKNPRPGTQIVNWLPRELLVVLLGLHGKDGLLEMTNRFTQWLASDLGDEPIFRRFKALEIPGSCLESSMVNGDLRSGYIVLDFKTGDYYPVNKNAYSFIQNHGKNFTVGQLLSEVPEFAKLA